MTREERDLPGDHPEYPSHIQINEFRSDGFAATLWLGNENSSEECDVMLTDEDIDWMIDVLQRIKVKE